MIPLPPPDRGVLGLATLLTEDAMLQWLATQWPDVATGELELVACTPRYVRYKPGTSALVRYDLTLRRGPDGEWTVPAHCTAFRGGRGMRHWQSQRMRRLLDRAASANFSAYHAAAFPIADLDATFLLYPIDYDLRSLVRAADPDYMRKVLRGIWAGRNLVPEIVRYKPGRKALLRYMLDDLARTNVFGKLHVDHRGERLMHATRTLREAGVSTPNALAYHKRLGMIIHEQALGSRLGDLRGQSTFDGVMDAVAGVLNHLHAVDVLQLPVRRIEDEAAGLHATATWLSVVVPDLELRLVRLAGEIAARLHQVPDAIATIHGDFYDDQVLLGDAGPTLLDLDEIRRGHPLLDIGNMAAHLAVGAESDGRLAGTGDTFVRAAVAEAGIWSERDVIPFEAAGLLRLAPAPFRNLEPDWVDRVERIVTLAETRLAAFDSRRFSGGAATPVDDPALPQLASLLDPARMNTVLARAVLGTLRGEESIHMVRHKPGRRAIIRYDVASRTGTTETLFGKTFASERGPRVYRVISTIAAAQALGAEVEVPEPVAFDTELKLLLQRATPGRPVVERVRTGDTSSIEAIAEAINHLHGSGLDLGRRHDLDREFAPLPGRVAEVGAHTPHLRIAAEHCLRDLLTRRDVAATWRWQPVHRDFYHDQVLIDGDRLAILDLDDAAMSEPAVDIANFAAHLRLLGIQERDDPAAFAPARRAFMTRAAALDPGLDESLLCLLEAATLVRLAGIHVSRDNGARVAQRLLAESHALLAGLPRDGRGTVLQRELTG